VGRLYDREVVDVYEAAPIQPRRSLAFDLPLKTFPVTVPIMGEGYTAFFRPLPQEELSEPRRVLGLFDVQYSLTRLDELAALEGSADPPGPEWFRMAVEAEELAAGAAGTGELLAPGHLAEVWRRAGVIPYPHQLETARRVLFEMGGRAILADEVGLGKTIEAGLVIKELMLRGLARTVLILTPASLCWQWQRELREKFQIACALQRSEYDWERCTVLVASIDTAKRSPHREIVERLHFDVLVVDEAHKLKNARSENYRFVSAIRRTYCLMLTATPVQNDLKELYTLITLIRPGQLGTYRQFKREFVEGRRTPKQPERLRSLLGRVMIRNRRGEGSVKFTARRVQSVLLDLKEGERRLYDEVTAFVRAAAGRAGSAAPAALIKNLLPLVTLQREVCSSPMAAAVTLEKMLRRAADGAMKRELERLLSLAVETQDGAKVEFLLQLVKELGEKVIVFTEYRATQQYLRWRLEQAGVAAFGFDGSLSASRKEWTRELFRRHGQVLVSTESGGEGYNFQFCAHVVNYDLPWNPMRLEQRIGRVHRLGQTRDVHIYNLATRQTIEEHILLLLYEKINMFQMVLGELDTILSHLKLGGSFERELARIVIASSSPEEMERRLEELAEAILAARREALGTDPIDQILKW